MQVAILVVLIIIAVLLAPWLLGVLAAAAALYGLWLVVAGVATLVIGIAVAAWVLMSEGGDSNRKACPNCQTNLHDSVHLCPSCGALL